LAIALPVGKLPRLKPALAGSTDIQQLKQQLQQQSRGMAQALLKQMVPRCIKPSSTAAAAAAANPGAARASAIAAGVQQAASANGLWSMKTVRAWSGAVQAVLEVEGAGVRGALAWQMRQHQETVAKLYSITAAALCSSLLYSAEQQEEQRVDVCDRRIEASRRQQQQQQQQQQRQQQETRTGQQGCEVPLRCEVDRATLTGHAAAAAADFALAQAAPALSSDGEAGAGAGRGAGAGASDKAAGMECMSYAVTADFSDCQDLLTVMAALLE
jgi:hypothetical protein